MGDWLVRLTTRLLRGETILFLALMLALPASVAAQGAQHRAGLVIRFGDGSLITRCVSFGETSISGAELLARAGLSIRVDTNSSIGAGVCRIEKQGCEQGKSCFCQCEGSTCAYWQYFHLQNGAWKYSNLGASLYQVSDGAVEGWAWGNNVAPPVMSLDQVCAAGPASAAPASTRVPVNTPTATMAPTATATVAPTVVSTSSTVPTTVTAAAAPPTTVPPTALPTLAMANPTPAPTATAPQGGSSSSAISLAVFGVIVLALGAWLVVQSRKRTR